MRTSIRLVTSSALGAILMLSLGVGATLAAPAPQKPTVQVIDLGEDWCFDDTVDLYCNVQTGTLTIKEWTDGSSESRVDMVTKTVVTHDGAFVARSKNCLTTSHFKRIDFDVKIDTLKSNCD
jgi:hypothetical protein